jgi:DNA-binding NarL/FixJ family response regulator
MSNFAFQAKKGEGLEMTRLFIFSPVRLFGDALAACLELQEQVSEVTCCHLSSRVFEQVVTFEPDAVLFDVNGEDAMKEACALSSAVPEIPLLAIAIPETPEQVIACANVGFVGYVPRNASVAELCTIVDMTIRGECVCHPRIAGSLLRELGHRQKKCSDSTLSEPLTRREREILRFLSRGESNKEIARELCLSLATVKNHVHNILAKLHVSCRTEAVSRLRDEPWLAQSA